MLNLCSCNNNNLFMNNSIKALKSNDNKMNEYDFICSLPTENIHASTVFDPNNLSSVIGFADYVFIGIIESYIETIYKSSVLVENKIIYQDSIAPRTIFKVNVIKNIKNNLSDNINIMFNGGVNKNNDCVFNIGDTTMPIIGNIYIFYGLQQADDEILLIGTDNNREIDINVDIDQNREVLSDLLNENSKYKDLLDAYKSELLYVDGILHNN